MIDDASRGPIRAFQWDLARQAERFEWLMAQLPRYADWGYGELYLHLEDAIEYPSLPGVARADAFSYRQIARLVAAAGRWGLRVVPIVNLWGHTQYLIKVPGLRDLNELRAPDGSPLPRGQVCPLHPRMMEVAESMVRDVAPFCTAGKVHVGLDETYELGRHPLSRAEIAAVGLAGHFARYAGRLRDLTAGFGLRMGMWADMLALLPEIIPLLPPGIIAYDWYYYPFPRRPRLELRNFRDYDLARPLRARGIEYWGCPMDGAFRHEPMPVFADRLENLISWWRRCRSVGAAGFLVTSWEPNRLAMELAATVDAAAASLWLDPGVSEPVEMLRRGFGRMFGKKRAARAARLALECDARAFSGYWRWEINSRWDVCADRDSLAACQRERIFFDRRRRRGRSSPPALEFSLAFRRYLAHRDVLVRRASVDIFRLRRIGLGGGRSRASVGAGLSRLLADARRFGKELKSGRSAARSMWALTRDRRRRSVNEGILDQDEERLRAWRRWLVRAVRDPGLIRDATPVCGAWQFRCVLRNFAPALQQVVLERQNRRGEWETLHRRFLIEFRAWAARPRARIRREFSVPVDDAGRPLRLALRGIGQVAVERVELTDGIEIRRPARAADRRPRILGRPAPRRGFPRLDWSVNRAVWPVRF